MPTTIFQFHYWETVNISYQLHLSSLLSLSSYLSNQPSLGELVPRDKITEPITLDKVTGPRTLDKKIEIVNNIGLVYRNKDLKRMGVHVIIPVHNPKAYFKQAYIERKHPYT